MNMLRSISFFDIVTAIIIATLALFFIAGRSDVEAKKLLLIRDNITTTLTWQTQKLTLEEGMVIEVEGDRARVRSSDCPDKICVASSWVSECGQVAACLPNRVVLMVDCNGGLDVVK